MKGTSKAVERVGMKVNATTSIFGDSTSLDKIFLLSLIFFIWEMISMEFNIYSNASLWVSTNEA